MFFTTLVQVVECGHSVRAQTWTADAEAEAVISSCIESATTIPMITILLTGEYVGLALRMHTAHASLGDAARRASFRALRRFVQVAVAILHPNEPRSEREQSRPAPLRSECACHRDCVRVVRRAWARFGH